MCIPLKPFYICSWSLNPWEYQPVGFILIFVKKSYMVIFKTSSVLLCFSFYSFSSLLSWGLIIVIIIHDRQTGRTCSCQHRYTEAEKAHIHRNILGSIVFPSKLFKTTQIPISQGLIKSIYCHLKRMSQFYIY